VNRTLGWVSRVLEVQASQNPADRSSPPEPIYYDG